MLEKTINGYFVKYKVDYEFRDGAVKLSITILQMWEKDKELHIVNIPDVEYTSKDNFIFTKKKGKIVSQNYRIAKFDKHVSYIIKETKRNIKQAW